jgi:preprotein translocase subunit SecG
MESNMQFQSKLIGSQQILKKTVALVLTISLLNAILLAIQYTHEHRRKRFGRLLSEGRSLGVESAHWRQR